MKFEEAPSRARRIVSDGDVIISTVRTYLRAIAYIEKSSENLICSTGFAVLSPKTEVEPDFLSYWVRSQYFVDEIVARSVGVSYPAINAPEIGSLPFPTISKNLQIDLASFLAQETYRIDKLIAKKERQIELLREKRLSVISRAVTKGLNPDAKMKDSGIKWLGEIPGHWKPVPLKWYVRVNSGSFISNSDFEIEKSENFKTPVIGGNGVMGYSDYTNVNEDTIAIGRVGAYCGNVHLVKAPAWITDNALKLSKIRKFDIEYLSVILDTLNLNRWAKQNAQPLVTGTMVKAQKVPLPPLVEQKEIVSFCRKQQKKIASLIDQIMHSIKLLNEYRTAIITAAVTGKIDVHKETA